MILDEVSVKIRFREFIRIVVIDIYVIYNLNTFPISPILISRPD